MRRSIFNMMLHVPIALGVALIAVTIAADPRIERVIPQATVQEKIDERLPFTRAFGPGTAEIKKAEVSFSNDDTINVNLLVDIDARGAPDTLDADFTVKLRYAEGDLYVDDLSVGRVDFDMEDVYPGSFQYTLLQGALVAGVSTMKNDMATKPVLELRKGPFNQRILGNLIEGFTLKESELHITLSPRQLIKGFLLEIILACGILIIAGAFIGRKRVGSPGDLSQKA